MYRIVSGFIYLVHLQEIYKIPKMQVLEERKKTERELDTNHEQIAKLEERKKKGKSH